MSLLFGELLRQYRQRKPSLSQARLAELAGYDPSILARMSQGKKDLTGPSGRERVVRILGVLHEEGVLSTLDEANALLEAAHMPPLYPGQSDEAILLHALNTCHMPADAAAPPTPASIPNNLPVQLSAFIGREQAIAQVRQLLGRHRLVTLTGTGGVGKTRLAVQVGASFTRADFGDGVWMAQLAPLADPALVPQTIASVFRLPPNVERTPTEALTLHLSNKQLLLILDNCEHLITACAELVEALLRACPRLRILTTSREALFVPGEVAWLVPSLSLPDPKHLPAFEQILAYESIQLFGQVATAAWPEFELTPENVGTVARICSRLDGIPLAVEMAAAQTAVMSLSEIATRLSDCFALLTSGQRTELPRHHTLRATLAWSYDLLSEPERVLLARLSVFADGCTTEAAQAVCADAQPGGVLPTTDVLPLLLQLAHKSLVVADTHREQSRYRLLGTVWQFATQKLAERGETDVVYERLGAYLESLANRHAISIEQHYGTTADALLEAELGNVRALVAWTRSQPGHAELILRVVTAFGQFWNMQGHIAEGLAWIEEGLASGGTIMPHLRMAALSNILRLRCWTGYNMARFAPLAREALALSEQVDDPSERFEIIIYATVVAVDQSDFDWANRLAEQGLALAEECQNYDQFVVMLNRWGAIRLQQGDIEGAKSFWRQACQWAQEKEAAVGYAIIHLAIADEPSARVACEQELARVRSRTNREDIASTLEIFGSLCLRVGDYEQAKAALVEALALWRDIRGDASKTLCFLGQAAWLQGDPVSAWTCYEQSLELYQQAGSIDRAAWLHMQIGYTLLVQGDLAGAASRFERGQKLYRELANSGGLVISVAARAALAEARGNHERAVTLFAAAQEHSLAYLCYDIVHPRQMAAALARFGGPEFAAAWAAGKQMTLEQALSEPLP